MEKLSEDIMSSLVNIKLNSISDVKLFCETANSCPCSIWLESGRYRVDAKSIMGIFSLDTSKTIAMEIENGEFLSKFAPWTI